MNNNNNVQTLSNHLEQEIKWVEQLNELLIKEKEELVTKRFEHLEDFAEKKQQLSQLLEESASARLKIMMGDKTKSPDVFLKEYIAKCSPTEAEQIRKLNNQLAEQLTTCRELNTVNGQVIATNIHTRQAIINTLSGNKGNLVSVYTATGDMKPSSPKDGGHHEKA